MEEAKRKAKANWKLPLRGEEGGMSLSRRRLTPGNSEKAEKKAERASERVPRADWRSARIEGHCAMLRGYCSHGPSSGEEQVHCNFLRHRATQKIYSNWGTEARVSDVTLKLLLYKIKLKETVESETLHLRRAYNCQILGVQNRAISGWKNTWAIIISYIVIVLDYFPIISSSRLVVVVVVGYYYYYLKKWPRCFL